MLACAGLAMKVAQEMSLEEFLATHKTYANGTIHVTVIDESGNPMPGIQVKGYFPSEFTDERTLNVFQKTDTQGNAIIKGRIESNELSVTAKKSDYYWAKKHFEYPYKLKYKGREKIYLPYTDSATLILRPMKDPVPLYQGNNENAVIPNNNGGYDLLKNDWVKPYGKGEVADCYFTTVRPDSRFRKTTSDMRFPNPGDGAIFVSDISS